MCRGLASLEQLIVCEDTSMKLTLTLIASAAYFALTLGAYAESASSQTDGVPGGTISTPGAESKGNPIPPATKNETKQGYVIVTPPPSEGTPVPPPPSPQ
jgi:hypothetical protein